jgi:hypothetical protein
MFKLNFTLLIIIINPINLILTDCPDEFVYCYNINNEKLGKILVNHFWTWLRFSCQPHRASTDQLVITYDKYIHECRHYYPATNEIQTWDVANIGHSLWRIHFRG